MTEKILIDRAVVEQALAAFEKADDVIEGYYQPVQFMIEAEAALRTALEQPQGHTEQHLDMVPEGWKLVPVEPTDDMLYDIQEFSHILPPRGKRIWAHMLRAAPQLPALEQPQVEREPVAWVGVGSVTWDRRQSEKVEKLTRKAQPEYGFVIPLYTHPQPKREPLTDEQINCLWSAAHNDTTDRMAFQVLARMVEATHGITGEQE